MNIDSRIELIATYVHHMEMYTQNSAVPAICMSRSLKAPYGINTLP